MNHRKGRTQPGFTLVEMNVVLFCLVLIAAIVLPSIVAAQRLRDLKDAEGRIVQLPTYTRNEAVKTQLPVRIRIDRGDLVVEEFQTNGTPQTLQQVTLPADILLQTAQLNNQVVDAGSWQWTAYPDGTSDSGGLQFGEGSATKSLVLTADGGLQWITGPLPDPTQNQWPAGQLQLRTSS